MGVVDGGVDGVVDGGVDGGVGGGVDGGGDGGGHGEGTGGVSGRRDWVWARWVHVGVRGRVDRECNEASLSREHLPLS